MASRQLRQHKQGGLQEESESVRHDDGNVSDRGAEMRQQAFAFPTRATWRQFIRKSNETLLFD